MVAREADGAHRARERVERVIVGVAQQGRRAQAAQHVMGEDALAERRVERVLRGQHGSYIPYNWWSRKQTVTARNTGEAETAACEEGTFVEALPLQAWAFRGALLGAPWGVRFLKTLGFC